MWNQVNIVREANLANSYHLSTVKINALYSGCQTEAIGEAFITVV